MKTRQSIKIIAAMFLLLFSGSIWAANIQITQNPVILERNINDNEIIVEFSLSWDNSWNLNSPPNHDAAWIFMKYRPLGQHGFLHANLFPVEHIVMGSDGAGTGSTRHNVEYGESPRLNDAPVNVGVFLSRSEISVGSNVFDNVRLHWDITGTGIDENTILSVRVYAIEMVFIPIGTFASIHTVLETGQLNTSASTAPGGVTRVNYTVALADTIAKNSFWPLGTQPFYIMKHEVSQHAWVDFLNSLTLEQQLTLSHINPTAPNNTRFGSLWSGAPFNAAPFNLAGRRFVNIAGTGFHQGPPDFRQSRMNIRVRQTAVGNTPAVFGINASQDEVGPTATPPGGWNHEMQGGNLPMFGLAWTDVMAYLDWAGLRPLTELEYEKAARGPLQVVSGEFAWGTTTFVANQSFDDRNQPVEVSGTPNANVALLETNNANRTAGHDGNTFARWPIRVGAFARETTTRIQAGASFWGVLNLSDNVAEQYVRFDVVDGWRFRGNHGDGNLTGEGLADVPDWPGVIASTTRAATTELLNNSMAAGTMFKGMGSAHDQHNIWMDWVSGRSHTNNNNWRNPWAGARGGRSVPVEFGVLAHPSPTPRGTNINNAASSPQGSVPAPWAALTHTLRVSAVGGEPPYTYQWFWTDTEPTAGASPTGGTAIENAINMSFLPPHNVAHGPRYFYAEITDQTGTVVTTHVSGMHTVLNVATNPSLDAVTTSTVQGTNELVIAPAGGAPPFTTEWFVIPNGTPNTQGGGGTFVGNVPAVMNYRPVIPIWLVGSHYTYWAQITDARGVSIRTFQSGPHTPGLHITEGGGRNVWFGPGNQENAYPDPLNNPQSRLGADVNPSDHIHQVNLTPGVYRLEAWGASSGRAGHIGGLNNPGSLAQRTHSTSGWGGYTQTIMRVENTITIFIVPGGSGVHAHHEDGRAQALPALPGVRIPGGFNGGGQGGSTFWRDAGQATNGGSGGGATHISFVPGLLTDPDVRDNILIVAGGAGGAGHSSSGGWCGVPGHTLLGTHWHHGTGWGPTENAGGAPGWWHSVGVGAGRIVEPQPGTAGRGGDGAVGMSGTLVAADGRPANGYHPFFSGGGGGGWFGGGGGAEQSAHSICGAGGSGFIAPFLRRLAGDIQPGSPHSGMYGNLSNPATGNVHQPGADVMSTSTPQHPQGAQNHTFVRGGAVRIIRLQ
jgi:formylglycine-generating enzyme required for sulfatase activity